MSAVNPLGSASFGSGDQRPYEPSMEEILASIRRIIADDQNLAGRSQTAEPSPPPEHEVLPSDMQSNEAMFREELGMPLPSEPMPEPVDGLHEERTGGYEHAAAAPPSDGAQANDIYPEHEAMMAHGHIAAPQYPMPMQAEDHEVETPVAAQDEAQPQRAGDHARDDHARDDHARDERFGEAEPVRRVAPPALGQRTPRAEPPPVDDGASEPAEPAAQLFSTQTRQSVSAAFNALAASRLADNSEELLDIARDMIRPLLKVWLDDNLPGMVERLIRAEIERVARGR